MATVGPGLYLTLEATTRCKRFAVRTGPVDARHGAAGTQEKRTVIPGPDADAERKTAFHWCIVSCEMTLSRRGNQGGELRW